MSNRILLAKNNVEEWDDYMVSYKWEKNKEQRMELDKHKCVFCGKEAYAVHHVKYVDNPLLNDNGNNLISVCESCHNMIHYGKVFHPKIGTPLRAEFQQWKYSQNDECLIWTMQDCDQKYPPLTWYWNKYKNIDAKSTIGITIKNLLTQKAWGKWSYDDFTHGEITYNRMIGMDAWIHRMATKKPEIILYDAVDMSKQ